MTSTNVETNGVALSAFYGIKAGMTRVFDSQGNHVPVTVIKLIPNVISQVKTQEKDGYRAYQIAYGEKRESLITSPIKGQLKKANIDKNFSKFAEISVDETNPEFIGKELTLDNFVKETMVDVTGISKGKGFQGVMKRFNFSGGPAAHGSHFHRTTGSIGQRATPARVYKERKLPGHMGCDKKTIQNLQVFEVNTQEGYMLIKGSVPGAKNSFVRVSASSKKNR